MGVGVAFLSGGIYPNRRTMLAHRNKIKMFIYLGWRREGFRVAVKECGMNLSPPTGVKQIHLSL
jgi:hypothetical protein